MGESESLNVPALSFQEIRIEKYHQKTAKSKPGKCTRLFKLSINQLKKGLCQYTADLTVFLWQSDSKLS